jgi:hypothetical protein
MLDKEIENATRFVKTDAYEMSVGELVNMYRDDELIINPDFQRLFRWEIGQKSKLIESILLGIPLPSIFVFEKDDGKWELIDGLQRLSTLLEFVGVLRDPASKSLLPPTALTPTKYLPSLDKTVWAQSEAITDVPLNEQRPLSSPLQLSIRRSRLSVQILKRPSANDTKYDLFQRLNAGGTQANVQELRNVIIIMVNPDYYQMMRRLSQREPFLRVLAASPDQLEKQRDMEFVSRYLVHSFVDFDNKLDVEEFIDKSIVDLAKDGQTQQAHDTFCKTFELLDTAYGQNALRRFNNDQATGRVLLAAYECIAIGIARNLAIISTRPDPLEYVRERIKHFWQSPEIDSFFVPGLRGTIRIQRTIPFGIKWFSQ